MNITTIICEYNPFHNGHKYQIEKLKKGGTTHVIAIMSGNFVQRGSISIINKYAKVRSALSEGGVDVVIELPTVYSCSCAERFAYSGIYLTKALGCVDNISFGCEDNNIETFNEIASILLSDEYNEKIKSQLKNNISFANIRKNVINEILDSDYSEILNKPNNILALEYIKAIKKLELDINIIPINRVGSAHDSNIVTDEHFSSASLLRKMIEGNESDIKSYMPASSYDIIREEISNGCAPASIYNIERAMLAKFRRMSKEEIKKLPEISEGLENRIYESFQKATSIDQIYNFIKSKRYSMSRIRRIAMYAFLDIYENVQKRNVPYIRILGFNSNGKKILRLIKEKSTIPLVNRVSDIEFLDELSKEVFKLESLASDMFNLAIPKPTQCGTEYKRKMIII